MIKLYPVSGMELKSQSQTIPEMDLASIANEIEKSDQKVNMSFSIDFEDELPSRPNLTDFFAYTLSIQKIWGAVVLSLDLENILQYSSENILNEASLNSINFGDSSLILESETPYLIGIGITYSF